MRATVMYGAGDVRVENVPDSQIQENTTDAIVRVRRACICGSDLWPYHLRRPEDGAQRMGHEAMGVVEEIGAEVRTLTLLATSAALAHGALPRPGRQVR